MKNIFKLSVALIFIFSFWSGTAISSPKIQHWTTENGTRVLFVPAPELPMLDIQITFNAGSARDHGHDGLAALTNSLLNDGTETHSDDEIAELFESKGARFGTSSHRDMAVLRLRSLSDPQLLNPSLDLLAKILSSSTFPPTSFERKKQQMLLGLQAEEESPDQIASQTFYQGLYGDHPYASWPSGTKASLESISRNDVLNFYKQYYVASNMVIAMVGQIDSKRAKSIAKTISLAVEKGNPAEALPIVNPLSSGKIIKKDFPSTQTHILVGLPGIKRNDPDYFALYVGNHILGGSGLVSRISEEVREKRGLSYSAYSYFIPMQQQGPYQLGLQTSNSQSQEALVVLKQTLQTFIEEGPTEEELKASKQNITGGFPLRLSSNKKIVDYLAMIGFYKLPLDYLDTFPEKVKAVTVKQIQEAFQRRIDPEKMLTVIVGNLDAAKKGSQP